MPDEIPASAQTPRTDGQQSQKMVIYMPEGAVIIERTGAEEHAHSAGDVIPEQTNVHEQAQPMGATSERTNIDEQQVLYRIAKILDGITERMSVNQLAQAVGAIREPNERGHFNRLKRHQVREQRKDWMHIINIAFIALVALVAIVPAALSTYFGIEVYASRSDSANVSIYQGDLMISKLVSASKLNVGDVLLLRNEHTWHLEVRQVTFISTSSSSGIDLTSITTESDAGAVSRDSYNIISATHIHKVTSVIPKFGDFMVVFTSILTKITVGLFFLILNIAVQIRRARKRRAEQK